MQIKEIAIKYFYAGQAIRRKTDGIQTDDKRLPFISICFCETGKYLFDIDGEKQIELYPGQAILIGSNVHHSITHLFDSNNEMHHKWIFLDVQIDGKYNLDQIFSLPKLLPDNVTMRLTELFNQYIELKHDGSLTALFSEKTIGYSILKEIAPLTSQISVTADAEFKECIDYINKHFLDNIKIEKLLELMHCSKSSLFDKFKKHSGNTPNQYIENLRLNHAAILLLSTNMKVYEIAKVCGFSDQLYFSKRFKKRYGKSPVFYVEGALHID